MPALFKPSVPRSNHTSSWPSSTHPDSAGLKLQALLFNTITIIFAAATLIVACIHLMHQRGNKNGNVQQRSRLMSNCRSTNGDADVTDGDRSNLNNGNSSALEGRMDGIVEADMEDVDENIELEVVQGSSEMDGNNVNLA
jgi:hypothetical protein